MEEQRYYFKISPENIIGDIFQVTYVDGVDVSMAFVEGLGIMGPVTVQYPEEEFYDYSLKHEILKNLEVITLYRFNSKLIISNCDQFHKHIDTWLRN